MINEMVHSLADWGLLCAVMFLFGSTLLKLLKPDLPALCRLGLSPLVSLSAWVWMLTVGMRVGGTISRVSLWVWGITLAVIIAGMIRSRRPRSAVAPGLSGRRTVLWAVFLCLIPAVLLLPAFAFGLGGFFIPRSGDSWFYVGIGEIAWHEPIRRVEFDIPDWNDYLKIIRAGTISMLGFFSRLSVPGDALSSLNLFSANCLLAVGGAALALGRALRFGALGSAVLAVAAVGGRWMCNVMILNNYDQLLALAFLPGLLVIIIGSRRLGVASAVLFGAFSASAVILYIETVPFVLAAAAAAGFQRTWCDRRFRRSLGFTAVAAAAAVFFLTPELAVTAQFIKARIASATGERRGGGDGFASLMGPDWPAAVLGMGPEAGEHPLPAPLEFAAAAAFAALLAYGAWRLVRRGDAGVPLALAVTASGAAGFILLVQRPYPYASYKLITFAWPLAAACAVAGIAGLSRLPARIGVPSVLAAAAACVPCAGTWWRPLYDPPITGWGYPEVVNLGDFRRDCRRVAELIGDDPVGIVSSADFPSEWLIITLRRHRLAVMDASLRSKYNGLRLRRDRERQVPPEQVRFLISDHTAQPTFNPTHWRSRFVSPHFALWERNSESMLAFMTGHTLPWPDHPWLGTGEDHGLRIVVQSCRGWTCTFEADILPGPSRTDADRGFAITVNGKLAWSGRSGRNIRAPISIPADRAEIVLYCTDSATVPQLPGGETRTLLADVGRVSLVAGRNEPDAVPLDITFRR